MRSMTEWGSTSSHRFGAEAPISGLAFPALVGALLPVGDGVAGGFEILPVAAGGFELELVVAVEEEDGALVAVERRRLLDGDDRSDGIVLKFIDLNSDGRASSRSVAVRL